MRHTRSSGGDFAGDPFIQSLANQLVVNIDLPVQNVALVEMGFGAAAPSLAHAAGEILVRQYT